MALTKVMTGPSGNLRIPDSLTSVCRAVHSQGVTTAQPADPISTASVDGLVLDVIRPQQVYELVAERLERQLADGILRPGERFPSERELARMFGVSRPSVREALTYLQNLGLVVIKPGAGTYATADAPARVEEMRAHGTPTGSIDESPVGLLEARSIIEPSAARLAAGRSGDVVDLDQLLGQMDAVRDVADSRQRQLWSDSDRLFHRQIADGAGNQVISRFAEYIAEVMDQPLWRALRDAALVDPARLRIYAAEHRLIYDAVRRGDATASEFYAAQHVRRVAIDMALTSDETALGGYA